MDTINQSREVPIEIRQIKYLNDTVEEGKQLSCAKQFYALAAGSLLRAKRDRFETMLAGNLMDFQEGLTKE